jgi:hypothetical protein
LDALRKYLLFTSILLGVQGFVLAQIDNRGIEGKDVFQYQPQKDEKEQMIPMNADGADIKTEELTLFGSLKDIADNFPTYSVIPRERKRSMTSRTERDRDVLVKKFWNGKDVSVNKFKTSLELGRYETSTPRIRIVCRDHSYVDGDRVKLYVNEQVIRRSITLEGGYFVIDVDLLDGFNRIDIEALNQGSSGPNTAEFKVFDDNGNLLAAREWNILTGYIATMVVMKN